MSRGSFLERWSRRKLTSGDPEEAPSGPDRAPDEAAGPDATEAMPTADTPDQETLDEETLDEAELAKLPPIEDITVKTNLAPFLRRGVPQALKNAAMRKMWMLDPAIRDHKDFAVDYAWDWNTPGGVPGNSGTISGKSLARMLESLNPKPVEAAAVQEEPGDEPPAGDERLTAAHAPPEASSPHHAPDSGASDAAESVQGDERKARSATTPRRHGGAVPT